LLETARARVSADVVILLRYLFVPQRLSAARVETRDVADVVVLDVPIVLDDPTDAWLFTVVVELARSPGGPDDLPQLIVGVIKIFGEIPVVLLVDVVYSLAVTVARR
jgi:hypothetical protein